MLVAHPHQRCAPLETVWATLRTPTASNAFGSDAGALQLLMNPIARPSLQNFTTVAPTLSETRYAVRTPRIVSIPTGELRTLS